MYQKLKNFSICLFLCLFIGILIIAFYAVPYTSIHAYGKCDSVRYATDIPNSDKFTIEQIGQDDNKYEESFQDIPNEYLTDSYRKVYEYLYTLNTVKNRNLTMSIDHNGMFRMTDQQMEQPYHVLQLTDIHITGGDTQYQKDILAIDAVYDLIKRTSPDFIVMTGDVIFGTQETATEEGKRAMDVIARLMDRIGIPWTWTFGNHDHDFFDRFDTNQIAQMLAQSKTLRVYTKQDEITGYTNGVFQLCDENDALVMALILLDSNDQLRDEKGQITGYDYIHDDQSEWFVSKIDDLHDIYNKKPENMLFFHMPLKEYETAWQLSQKDGNEAEILFGRCNEKISASANDSLIFQRAVGTGCTRALFCGHDHTNDFGVKFMNIDLIYSKSIDFVAYPGIDQLTEQRGATLITIQKDSNYQVEQIRF